MRNLPLLITDVANIQYLMGFSISFQRLDIFILQLQEKLYLLTNALYLEEVINLLNKRKNIKFLEISPTNTLAKILLKILNQNKFTKLGYEINCLTVSEFKNLRKKLPGIKLIPTNNIIEKLRIFKKSDEILNISTACIHTDECFKYIIKQLKPKVSEKDIAWKIEKYFKEKNIDLAFSPVVAFEENSSQPHHSPSYDKYLKSKDIVLLDFGARVNGYCADMTRTIFIGQLTSEQKKAYLTLLKVYQQLVYQVNQNRKSINGADLNKMAKRMIKQAGFPPYEHGLGHGVGLQIHEAPKISHKKPEILKPGMVFTLEPAIYIPGKFGIRLENTVLLTKKGIESLTNSPFLKV